MPLFPPGVPVTIVVDGRSLAAYARAYVVDGRVFAPVHPLLTGLADRIYYERGSLVVERGNRRATVMLLPASSAPSGAYVMVAPVLHALGASVHFDARQRVLFVRVTSSIVPASATPFNGVAPRAPSLPVFTPEPVATPRPVWTGSPLPRRTPLPFFTAPAVTARPSP